MINQCRSFQQPKQVCMSDWTSLFAGFIGVLDFQLLISRPIVIWLISGFNNCLRELVQKRFGIYFMAICNWSSCDHWHSRMEYHILLKACTIVDYSFIIIIFLNYNINYSLFIHSFNFYHRIKILKQVMQLFSQSSDIFHLVIASLISKLFFPPRFASFYLIIVSYSKVQPQNNKKEKKKLNCDMIVSCNYLLINCNT